MVEADESDGTFLSLVPDIAVVTNVEADHLDHYGSFDAVRAAFEAFVASARVRRVVGGDDPVAAEIGPASRGRRGRDGPGQHLPHGRRRAGPELAWPSALVGPDGASLGRLAVPVPGLHNAKNAAVATVAALAAGVPFDAAARALARFAGVARRFEFRGDASTGSPSSTTTPTCPTEVRAALAAARDGGWAAGGGRLPAPPVQPDRGARGGVRRGLRRRRRGGGHRRLRGRRGPGPRGLGPPGGRRRPAEPTRTSRCTTSPAGRTSGERRRRPPPAGDLC